MSHFYYYWEKWKGYMGQGTHVLAYYAYNVSVRIKYAGHVGDEVPHGALEDDIRNQTVLDEVRTHFCGFGCTWFSPHLFTASVEASPSGFFVFNGFFLSTFEFGEK